MTGEEWQEERDKNDDGGGGGRKNGRGRSCSMMSGWVKRNRKKRMKGGKERIKKERKGKERVKGKHLFC